MELSTIVPLAVLAALLIYGVGIHHRLATLGRRYRHAFVQVEVQLKHRHALVAELLTAPGGALADAREALAAVTLARDAAESRLAAARPGEPWAMARLSEAEKALGAALAGVREVAEASPARPGATEMERLGEALERAESRIAFARHAFNDAVLQYNRYRRRFPPALLAGAFGHGGDAAPLSFDDAPRPAPRHDA